MIARLDEWVRGLAADSPVAPGRARAYRLLLGVAILVSTGIAIVDTVPGVWSDWAAWVHSADKAILLLLTLDYAVRLRVAWATREDGEPPWLGLGRYAFSAYGIFDLIAAVPFPLNEAVGLSADAATVFGILRFLKLARYSPALETLGAVIIGELRPLVSALFIVILLALFAATALYFAERHANPHLASVPDALWWAIVTLTTVGYGDVVPATALGKMLNGVVAVLGLCMFALPASILATGFAEEMRRHNFVANWRLVARVPAFARLDAAQIAEIAALLKPYTAVRGEVLMRAGENGRAMFFIVSGRVGGVGNGTRFTLGPGDFVGEIAIIENRPRTATVTALTRCRVLILNARDFQNAMGRSPELLATIRKTARRRMAQAGTGLEEEREMAAADSV